MTEAVIDVGSSNGAEAPDAGASANETTSDTLLFPDADATQESAPEPEAGHSAEATDSVADDSKVDLLRTPVDELPENLRPLAPLAKNLQAAYTRSQQDLREREAQLAQREQQIQAQNQQAQQHQQQWADRLQQAVIPDTDPIQQMRASLTADENQAIDTVQAIVQHQVGTQLQQMQGQIDTLRQENDSLKSGYSGVHNYMTEQAQVKTRQDVQQAIDRYGEDVRRYGQQILHMLKSDAPPNPRTGRKYTVIEAYEQVSGRTQQAAEALRNADQQAKRSSKRRVAANSSVDSSEDAGPLSETEVINQLKALGFE